MNRRQQKIEQAEFDTLVAGTRAATFLGVLLKHKYIPEHHINHAREIVKAHAAANARWDSHVREDDGNEEPTPGEIVRISDFYVKSQAGDVPAGMEGELKELNGYRATVKWDDGRTTTLSVDYLVRVA